MEQKFIKKVRNISAILLTIVVVVCIVVVVVLANKSRNTPGAESVEVNVPAKSEPSTSTTASEPTTAPSESVTEAPTEEPTTVATELPTEEPAEQPTEEPTEAPTEVSTEEPTTEPTEEPTTEPTTEPVVEPTEPTEGLLYELNVNDKQSYTVFAGSAKTERVVVIPEKVGRFPVTVIGSRSSSSDGINFTYTGAFEGCFALEKIYLPSTIRSIGIGAFFNCERLTDIYFDGTCAQWESITKGASWNYGTPTYTVHCTDGAIEE